MTADNDRVEGLGPAERAIQTLTTMTDHMVHNRPGVIFKDEGVNVGVRWMPAGWKLVDGKKEVYLRVKSGKKTEERPIGVLEDDGQVYHNGIPKFTYRLPGATNKLFPEIAAYIYRQVADIWKMDNQFAAHWASYAFKQDNRDLKTVLAAFMLVQDRCGAAVIENGETLFFDDDYREVGEAMFLIRGRGHMQLEPKLILRVGDLLGLPEIAAINRELGFGKSARRAAMGRYNKAVTKWLNYREQNPQMLKGLVDSGQGNVVRSLARRVRYKPQSANFFRALGWSQKGNMHRTVALDEKMQKDSLKGLTEEQICEKIVADKIGHKRLVGMLQEGQEFTRAMMGALIESGGLSDKDLVILTPTLEAMGLLVIEPFKTAWTTATKNAQDQRASNIARNTTSKEAKQSLETAVDVATEKAFEEVTRGMRIYCMVDKSISMQQSLGRAKDYLARFVGGFPLDKLHVSVFNNNGTEIKIKAQKKVAVEQAFRGHEPSGGTVYAAGLQAIQHHRPAPDEDVLFFFVGDQAGEPGHLLAQYILQTGLNPVAFGFLYVPGMNGNTVEAAAATLGIPCFGLSEDMFDNDDPYAVTRIIRDMINATPVSCR